MALYTNKQAVASTEADHIVVSDVPKGGPNTYHLLNALMQVNRPISIYMDNQGAIQVASNLVTKILSHYIDFRQHMSKRCANNALTPLN